MVRLGLAAAQGLQLSEAFYWDLDDTTRAFAKRFAERRKRPPTAQQAGVYSSIAHYLKAVKALGDKAPEAVMAKMRELPIEDFMTKNGTLRIDGRVMRDMYLFEVKSPSDSKTEWDYYKVLATIPGDRAFAPPDPVCPLVKK